MSELVNGVTLTKEDKDPNPVPPAPVPATMKVEPASPPSTSTSTLTLLPPPPRPSPFLTPTTPTEAGGVDRLRVRVALSSDVEEGLAKVKVIADNHAQLRQKMEETKQELVEKRALLKQLEREVFLVGGNLEIAEQKLRSEKERHFRTLVTAQEVEQLHAKRLRDLVEMKWKTAMTENMYKKIETRFVEFHVERAIRVENVKKAEEGLKDPEARKQLDDLKDTVKKYEEYKERLAAGDPELTRIMNGNALIELEERKNSIKDAYARREAKVEAIYMEIDEKNEAVKGLNQQILIKEKQNRAKLRRLQREVQEKEETEHHLKQAVEYLERQIDPAVGPRKHNSSYFKPSGRY